MPRPKERKREDHNSRNQWLNEFEDTRRRYEDAGREKQKKENK